MVALATVKHFVEPVVGHESDPTDIITEFLEDTSNCVINLPTFDNTTKPHDMTEDGVKVLSIGCTCCHILATLLLFFGIGGQYKKRNNKINKNDLSLIISSFKGMLKQVF